MNGLKMKVAGFDPVTGTIEMRFASAEAARPIDEYPSHVIQVLEEGGGADIDGVIQMLATAGWDIAAQQQAVEDQAKDSARMRAYMAIVGNEYSFDFEDVFPPAPPTCAAPNQPHTSGLIEI